MIYTVKAAESAEGIAIRELGDHSRDLEILELNRDLVKFSGLYPFEPGTIIELPPKNIEVECCKIS